MAKGTSQTTYDPNDIRGLARLISQVEAREPAGLAQMAAIHRAAQGARFLGVTGPPGAGKSTLVDQLIRKIRANGERVAVIAIDPSSPFTGGAVLGDRIRMQAHASDDGVFIRSLGSRGAHGGLSRATRAIAEICAAYHYRWVIIETVGVGQSEFDIMELADTTLVVLVPESGDTVQTLKAGLLEIADLFIVNKGDRDGANQMAQAMSAMVQLGQASSHVPAEDHDASHQMTQSSNTEVDTSTWHIPVITTTATTGDGVEHVWAMINKHHTFLQSDAASSQRKASVRRQEFLGHCAAALNAQLQQRIASTPALQSLVDAVAEGRANPYETIKDVVDAVVK